MLVNIYIKFQKFAAAELYAMHRKRIEQFVEKTMHGSPKTFVSARWRNSTRSPKCASRFVARARIAARFIYDIECGLKNVRVISPQRFE
jgi:hypothetical protein